MKKLFLLTTVLFLGLLLAACNSNPQPAGLTPVPTQASGDTPTLAPTLQDSAGGTSAPAVVSQGNAAQGGPLYLENCSHCHGRDGEGGRGPALRTDQFVKTAGDQAIFNTIANGRPGKGMPTWSQASGGKLTDAQIYDIIAYLHDMQSLPPLPSDVPVPSQSTSTP